MIRNTKVAPVATGRRQDLAIVGESISTVIKNQGIGDLYRLYVEARNQKLDFNYGAIPPDFAMASNEPFDVAYMNALFKYGYQLGRMAEPVEEGAAELEHEENSTVDASR